MMFLTHLLFGILAGIAGCWFTGCNNQPFFVAVSALASTFPDIDHTASRIGRKLPPLSLIVNTLFGHRGVTHSIWIPVIVYMFLSPIDVLLAAALFTGITSHLILDAMTPAGIRPLYPLKAKIKGPFKTNSFVETLITLFLMVMVVVLVSKELIPI